MPLMYEQDDLALWRYQCSCLHPTHGLVVSEDKQFDDIWISVESNNGLSFLQRLKVAFWFIVKSEKLCVQEVILSKNDRNELSELLKVKE